MFRTFALSAILAIASAQEEAVAVVLDDWSGDWETVAADDMTTDDWSDDWITDDWTIEWTEDAVCPKDAWDEYWGWCKSLCDEDWWCYESNWEEGCESGNYYCDDWSCYCEETGM